MTTNETESTSNQRLRALNAWQFKRLLLDHAFISHPGRDASRVANKTTSSSAAAAPASGGRLKRHIVAKKKEEYEDYANQIKALIQQYVPPDKDAIEQARQKGNIALSPEAGTPGQYKLVISNYLEQGDNLTLVVDKAQKELASVSIASYLNDPKDAVNVTVQFSPIPGGPNHVSPETIDGVSKQLTIAIRKSNYQKTT